MGFCTGIPGYGLRTEMIRNFFPFPLCKGSGIPDQFRNDFLSVNRKFPEPCFVIPERSEKFRFTEKSFRNFPGKGSGKTLETSYWFYLVKDKISKQYYLIIKECAPD